jgi:putative ubiquitin-RnfH superfamily antitoxin RatB of RatAB toxin-antitoxin module
MKTQKTIFELKRIKYDSWKKPKYPEFKVTNSRLGIFSDLAKAEQGMKAYVEPEEGLLFGFSINEFLLDELTYWWAVSRRIYLPDGSLLDECLVSEVSQGEGGLERFLGRPAEKIRFEIGDLAEVLHGDRVTLEIVGNLPCTPEEVRQKNERAKKDFPNGIIMDHSDDCYYTLGPGGGHSHPASTTMFPVRLKVSKKLKEKLLSDEYYSYRALYDNLENQKK